MTSSRLGQCGLGIHGRRADEGIGSPSAALADGKCFVALTSKFMLTTLLLRRLAATATFGGLQRPRHQRSTFQMLQE